MASEALACGVLAQVVDQEALETRATALCAKLASRAPKTFRAVEESARRLIAAHLAEADDLISDCYSSDDFKRSVAAFLSKEKARKNPSGRGAESEAGGPS